MLSLTAYSISCAACCPPELSSQRSQWSLVSFWRGSIHRPPQSSGSFLGFREEGHGRRGKGAYPPDAQGGSQCSLFACRMHSSPGQAIVAYRRSRHAQTTTVTFRTLQHDICRFGYKNRRSRLCAHCCFVFFTSYHIQLKKYQQRPPPPPLFFLVLSSAFCLSLLTAGGSYAKRGRAANSLRGRRSFAEHEDSVRYFRSHEGRMEWMTLFLFSEGMDWIEGVLLGQHSLISDVSG